MPVDRFGIPFFYPSKAGGYFYEMSDNPKSDGDVDWPSEVSFSGSIATMHPNGPTDFGIGKNIAGFSDSIGGCNMDFKATAKRGYSYKADDARDIEFKCLMNIPGNLDSSHDGFSISFCTGHHNGNDCCQGFAYMGSMEGINSDPTKFRFRKETVHVEYTDSSEGTWSHPKCDFKVAGHGWIGMGACRYNKKITFEDGSSSDSVILEIWFNPDPTTNLNDWTMLKRTEDKLGRGWTGSKNKCNGDSDQIGTWSGAQNRMKTNSTSGSIQFKSVTLREVNPFGTFEETPPPDPGGGGSGGGGIPPPPVYTYSYKFGTNGSGDGEFLNPHDVSFDATGNCFVCDRDRNDVQKFTHEGVFLSKFGSSGSGNGQFNVPYAIQHTPDFANIYVMDRDNNRIQKLDSAGAYVSKITAANGKNLNAPEDICFDGLGNFYICDTGNNRVVKFVASTHAFVLEWGSLGNGNGQFDHPHSMDMGLDGNVYINSGNQPYIQVFSPTGMFLRKFSKGGTHDGELLTFLEHLDIDYKGRLHIINNNARPVVQVFNCTTGNFITKYGKETEGTANGQFKEPEHVTVDSVGRPFVVDSSNFRIQVFAVEEPPPIPDPDPGGGGGGGPPAEPSKVKGTFTLKRDINISRTDPCEGTGGSGGGGGGGGAGVIYDAFPLRDKQLSDTSLWSFRTRLGTQINKTGSGLYNKILKQLSVPLKKVGSPAASPTITAVIWDKNNTVVYTSPTAIDPTTLPTSFDPADPTAWEQFDFSANTHVFVLGDRIGVRYFADSSTSDVNYVVGGYEDVTTAGNTTEIQYESSVWKEHTDRDWAAVFYD